MGDFQSCFGYDRYGILFPKAKPEGALQRGIPEGIRHRLLHLARHPVLARRPRGTRMKASNVISTIRNLRDCNRLQKTHIKHQKLIKVILAAGPLQLFAMDLLGSLKKTARGNAFTLVITDQFSRTTTYIMLPNTKSYAVTAAFLQY